MPFFLKTGLLVGMCYALSMVEAAAQPEAQVVQFYGIVFYEDSLSGAIGAHIYHPTTLRGSSTDYYGYFSLPVAVGDTMRISYQGYQTQHIVIPSVATDSYSQLIYLQSDTVELEAVEVTPYMSEQEFKAAILSLHNERSIYRFFQHTDALQGSSALNYSYFVGQQQLQEAMRYEPNYIPATDILLKPLINAIKGKKEK